MEIATTVVRVTTTGSAGSATGSATTPVLHGYLLDIYFDFHGSAPATTDTTVAHVAPSLGNIIVISNSVTDALHAPRKQASDAAGSAISGVWDLFPLTGQLTFSLAQCDQLTDALVAYVRYLSI